MTVTERRKASFGTLCGLVLNGKSSSGTRRTGESERLVGHPSCALWTDGWKAGTVVGLGAVSPTPNKRKTCVSSPVTVTNVSAGFVLVVVVRFGPGNVEECQIPQHLEFVPYL